MPSWLAGRVALPRPVALGTLGVRVMVERTVVRGAEDEEVQTTGVKRADVEEEEEGTGELRPEEGEDLTSPLVWFWWPV